MIIKKGYTARTETSDELGGKVDNYYKVISVIDFQNNKYVIYYVQRYNRLTRVETKSLAIQEMTLFKRLTSEV